MLIIIISGLCMIGGLVWCYLDAYSIGGPYLAVISGMVLTICLIFLVTNPIMVNANIEEYKSIKNTIQIDRGNDNIENAALKMKIIDANRWLAKTQYYNTTMLGLWIPDEIEELEFIK